MATIINKEDMINKFETELEPQMDDKDIAFYWNNVWKGFCLLNKKECNEFMKSFKYPFNSGKVNISEENNKTFKIKGKEWHILVIQSPLLVRIDPSGFLFDETTFLIEGYIYLFKHKENRDQIFEYFKNNSKKE